MNSHYVSIVIPTYNRINSLLQVLNKLKTQTFNEKFEVIVVNDGSNDGTQEALYNYNAKNFDFKLINQKNLKQGAARNNGVKNSKGNLIVFIQDDIFPSENFLKTHVNFHLNNKHENIVGIGKTQWTKELQKDSFHQFLDGSGKSIIPSPLFDYKNLKDNEETDFKHFYTNNISIKKSFFNEEKFNEEFNSYGWEDIEIGFRLFKKGMKIYYLNDAIAEHNHKYSFTDYTEREKNVAINFNKMLHLQPEISSYFKQGFIKKIIFKIFTRKLFLSMLRIINRNLFWYFTGKNIWLVYNKGPNVKT